MGDTIWASAVEKHLPVQLYTGVSQPALGLEQCAYRITAEENDEDTLLDPQSVEGFEMMVVDRDASPVIDEQQDWYDADYSSGYNFSWVAFLCDRPGGPEIPTSLNVEYSSLESAYDRSLSPWIIDADDNADFRGIAVDYSRGEEPNTMTMLGEPTAPRSALGSWENTSYFIPDGVSNVVGVCADGVNLETFTNADESGPITSKSFVILEQLRIYVGEDEVLFDSNGVTLGVTGNGLSVEADAALWGITTIGIPAAEAAPTPYTGPVVTSATDAAASGAVTVSG